MRATNAVARKRRHKRVLKAAKGFRGSRSKTYRKARETLMRAGNFAYRDRRVRKREYRQLWIVRINAAARAGGMNYSTLMSGLRKAGVEIDRKQLSEVAILDPTTFASLMDTARAAG